MKRYAARAMPDLLDQARRPETDERRGRDPAPGRAPRASSACSKSRPITAATRSASRAVGSSLSRRVRITACTVSGSDSASAPPSTTASPSWSSRRRPARAAPSTPARGRTGCRLCVRRPGAPARPTPGPTRSTARMIAADVAEIERIELQPRVIRRPLVQRASLRSCRDDEQQAVRRDDLRHPAQRGRRGGCRPNASPRGARPACARRASGARRPTARRAAPPAGVRPEGGAEADGTRSAPTADGDRAAGTARATVDRAHASDDCCRVATPRRTHAERLSQNLDEREERRDVAVGAAAAVQHPRPPVGGRGARAARTADGSCRRRPRRQR